MAGRFGGEYQSLHNELEILSFEWRRIPVLPDAIKRYQDIIKNPTEYAFSVDHFGEVVNGDLEDALDLGVVTLLYDLTSLQTPDQREKSEDNFSVTFDSKPMLNILAQKPLSDITPTLRIERTPHTIDEIMAKAEDGELLAQRMTSGLSDPGGELRDIVGNFFVGVMRTTYFPINPVRTVRGVELNLGSMSERRVREESDAIHIAKQLMSGVPSLSPDKLKRIEIWDNYARQGVLLKK